MSETTESHHQTFLGPKKKASKSRNGCLTCKKKRLKCDETKPSCLKCLKKNIVCGGYAIRFKWRLFNDSNDSWTPNSDYQETPTPNTAMASLRSVELATSALSVKSPDSFRKHLELASLSVTGKSIKDIKRENDLILEGINPLTYLKNRHPDTSKNNTRLLANLGDSSLTIDDRNLGYKRMKRSYSQPEEAMDPRAAQMARSFTSASLKNPYNDGSRAGSLSSLADVAIDEINKSPNPSQLRQQQQLQPRKRRNTISQQSPRPLASFSPSLSDFLSPSIPIKSPVTNMNVKLHSKELQKNIAMSPASHSNFDLNIKLSPSLSALINSAFGHEDEFNTNVYDENLKLNIPLSPLTLQTGPPHEVDDGFTPSATPASIKWPGSSVDPHALSSVTESFNLPNDKRSSHDSAVSPGMSQGGSLYSSSSSNASLMHSSEQQQILGLYAQYTSEILSIKNGPYENPWRRLILPLAFDYSCLYNSIASLTLFHLVGNESVAATRDTLRARGYIHMKKCILELASGLSKIDSNDELSTQLPADIAIAICLNLAVSESWDKHISSGIAHLKGAKTMIQKVLSLLRDTKKTLSSKRRLAIQSPDTVGEEYGALIVSKKKQLKKRLVLVEDSEWDSLLTADEDNDTCKDADNKLVKYEESEKALHIPKSTQFLFNIWIYFEVLAQMTTEANNDEKGIDLVASITTLLHEQKSKKSGNKSKGNENIDKSPGLISESSESTFASIEGSSVNRGFNIFDNMEALSFNNEQIDPLLGCAQSLFSIMGKVATLVSRIRKNKSKELKGKNGSIRNTLATITVATQLRQQLLSWKPTISTSMMQHANGAVSDADADLSSTITTAEAYRYSALLYLHHAIPEIPSPTSHQLAEKIFILLASIPTTSSTYTTHIFPLLVASCEAEPTDEREWCTQRWEVLSKKLWIGNVDRAFEVVKEVWKRKDDYVRKKLNNTLGNDDVFISLGKDKEKLRDISNQMSGLMAAISSDQGGAVDDVTGGIFSKLHWSSVMREWGWEVLLG